MCCCAALHDLFAAGPPTLLVLEDLHWADGATLDALRYLGRRIADVPVLVVATYRDEARRRAARAAAVARRAHLAARASASHRSPSTGWPQLVDAATASAVDAVALHADTGGNPFYVTEVLAGGRDDVPATVRDAVLARTARLSDGAQRTLAAVAVLGARPARGDHRGGRGHRRPTSTSASRTAC